MNYPVRDKRLTAPDPDAQVPYHPETHWDIRELELTRLPTLNQVIIGNRQMRKGWNKNNLSPNQIREEMESFFFTHPTATFVLHNSLVLAFTL